MGISDRLKHSWEAFRTSGNERVQVYEDYGVGSSRRPDITRTSFSNERSIIASIYTRIAIDVAAVSIKHVRLDENERYSEVIKSDLNECLTIEANIDQSARDFRMDIVNTLFDKGFLGIVPVTTTLNPMQTGGYDIKDMRVGYITQWYPEHVTVSLYNEKKGYREDITLPKHMVTIVVNPLYSVMNESNSTLQRLRRKLAILDAIDEQSGAGKLDIIIQLPYVVKSETRKQQAEQRRKDIEVQMTGSKYGIAYTDATERITQLNRPAENNLLAQVQYLTDMLYNQLGLTEEIFNGTADEQTMINYFNRTIEPLVAAITENMKRTFLTKTARSQGQSIEYFREPFKFVPVSQIAEIADTFTRNEILTSNELRAIMGFKPSTEPKADQLVNSNIPQEAGMPVEGGEAPAGDDPFAALEATVDKLINMGGEDGDTQ